MKIAGWIIFTIAHLWVGALLDFNLWGIIPMSLAFLGANLVGHADAIEDMRKRLYAILQVEVDEHDR
jgi:hypothetical protein